MNLKIVNFSRDLSQIYQKFIGIKKNVCSKIKI